MPIDNPVSPCFMRQVPAFVPFESSPLTKATLLCALRKRKHVIARALLHFLAYCEVFQIGDTGAFYYLFAYTSPRTVLTDSRLEVRLSIRFGNNKVLKQVNLKILDRDLCIGVGSCAASAPTVFALDDEDKAVVLDPCSVDHDTLLEAAESCPAEAITIEDNEGNQLYP